MSIEHAQQEMSKDDFSQIVMTDDSTQQDIEVCVFEPTCAYAWWVLMHRVLSLDKNSLEN